MTSLKELLSVLAASRYVKWLQYAFFVGVAALLIHQVSVIGWTEVLASLPTHPLFYVIAVILLFSLPITEVFIYRISWRFKGYSILGMLIKKSVINREVMGYSGEVLAYSWARNHVDLPSSDILKTIRDNNILSSIASTVVAIGLVAFFVAFGELSLSDLLGETNETYVAIAVVAVVIISAFAYRYRRFWFSTDSSTALTISAIYVGRQLVGMTLQIIQWAVTIPEVDLKTWFTFGAVSLILSRIPVIPSRDLIFVSAGIGLAGVVDISTAAVAGMLLVSSALRRVIHLAMFVSISVWENANPAVAIDGQQVEASVSIGEAAKIPADESV